MNWLLRLLLLLPIALLVTAFPSRVEMKGAFDEWRTEHGIHFDSMSEMLHRFTIFEENHLFIYRHNHHANSSYSLGHNRFSHLTHTEFAAVATTDVSPIPFHPDSTLGIYYGDAIPGLPEHVDWVEKGGVTPVKDQGQCGSCWSFSATGALEGAQFAKSGSLLSLSEQQLVDCDEDSSGCGGGLMSNAFHYVAAHGLATEAEYPYTAAASPACSAKLGGGAGLKPGLVQHVIALPPGNEAALQAAVAQQPVSVAIEASGKAFQFYRAGVFNGVCGHELDHGVLAVGYGTQDGLDYWKVKNSWGPGWGTGGFILIARGTGLCGIADSATFPLLQ